MDHILKKLEHESLREAYFLTVALILAFGMLQTTGTAMNTDRPVVSVVSCSMYPTIGVGDIILVQGKSYENINEGDVLVFKVKEVNVTVGEEEYYIRDYGDGTVDTAAGNISISAIIQDTAGQAVGAVIDVDGEQVRLIEGEAAEINGERVQMEEAVGGNIPVIHRVVEKNDDYVETKGDNNRDQLQFEKRIQKDQIHGVEVFKIPKVGGLKLLVMDILGYSGDQPFEIDTYPQCDDETPGNQY